MLHKYVVGELYHADRTNWPEKGEFNFRAGAHELLLFMGALKESEIEGVRSGRVDLALYVQQPVVVLLYRIAGFSSQWSDAPYSWHLVKAQRPEEATLPQARAGEQREILDITLVAAETGVIKALRVVTFSPHFTRALHGAIRDQVDSEWDAARYERAIATIYDRYPTSGEMVKDAVATCRGGD